MLIFITADQSKLWYKENFNLFSSLVDSKMLELNSLIRDEEANKNKPVYFANDPSKNSLRVPMGYSIISTQIFV